MSALDFLDDELLSKIKTIQLRAKHLVSDTFAGDYLSAFKGRGMEFEEVREYQPGDDIRSIDWNVTARSDRPYIKTYRDERELTVMFMVDVSASSRFGTVKKFKNEVSAELTALLAYAALRNNDKVGLIIFSDHVEHYIPAKKGRGHVWRLIREILSYKSESRLTNMTVPLEFLERVLKKRSICFLISDFLERDCEQKLRSTSKRHDLIAVEIIDPAEISLPNIGYIELEDAESGESILINTRSREFRENYTKRSGDKKKGNRTFFNKSGIDVVQIQTNKNYFDAIVKFFKQREKRR